MITHPSAQEILQAVSRWIEDLRPQLDERNAFLARVAVNALATVGRELDHDNDTSATERLSRLLEKSGSHDELTRELCAKMRTGEFNVDTPGLLAILKADTLEQLAIDQPGYRY